MVASSETRPWRLNLLGRMELLNADGIPVPISAKNALAALAYVSSRAGENLARAEVAGLIWTGCTSKAALDSLRNALVVLRKVFPHFEASRDYVSIPEGKIECDWLTLDDHTTYRGEFMPGLDQEWVIETRLELRNIACESAVSCGEQAWEAGDRAGGLELIERACAIDPWNEDAAALRVKYLNASGQRAKAFATADAYRIKVIREMGTVSNIGPEVSTYESHPLLTAAEWLLDRNPADALSMLVATQSQWLSMPVEAARDFHRRSLAVNPTESSERRLVKAQHVYLTVMAGRLTNESEDAVRSIEQAVAMGEPMVAARLGGALAYGHLSRGDFGKAVTFAEDSLAFARQTKRPEIAFEFEQQLAVVLQHVGRVEESRKIHRAHAERSEYLETSAMLAQQLMASLDPLIFEGKIDVAAENLQRARRLFEANGAGRILPWLLLGESMLHEEVGDYYEARRSLGEIVKIGSAVGGQA
ncbi:MAG: bacterial transcriptional activator domain-containing protein, partial [Armatimonadetes bacterium]|nr:bacterial transcriptional activator domain-containing protein [Armatimonadota bacterium]